MSELIKIFDITLDVDYDYVSTDMEYVFDTYEDLMWTCSWCGIGTFLVKVNRNFIDMSKIKLNKLLQIGNEAYRFGIITSIQTEIGENGKITENVLIGGKEYKGITTGLITNFQGIWDYRWSELSPQEFISWTDTDIGEIVAEMIIGEAAKFEKIIDPSLTFRIDREFKGSNIVSTTQGQIVAYVQSRFKNLGQEITDLLTSFPEFGWRSYIDDVSKEFWIDTYKSRDKSNDIVFGDDIGNIQNIKYLQSDINYSNSVMAGGTGEGQARLLDMAEYGASDDYNYLGLSRNELFLNMSDMMSEGNLLNKLNYEKLLYTQLNYFEVDLITECDYTFTHDQDITFNTYSLGDKIKIRYKALDYEEDMQILEVTENWKVGSPKTVKLQLGKAIPTISSKITEQQKYNNLILRR